MKPLSVKNAILEGVISLTERILPTGEKMLCLTDLSDGSEFLQEEAIEGKPAFFGVLIVVETVEHPEITMQKVHGVYM